MSARSWRSPGSASTASQRSVFATPEEHIRHINLLTSFQVNYKRLAELAGYTNERSASNAWAIIKKKINAQAAGLGATNGDDEANGDATTPKPTPSKRGRPKAEAANGETPTKKAKGGKGEKGKKGESVEAGDDEVDDSPLKQETEEDAL